MSEFENLTDYGRFTLLKFPKGQRVIVKTQDGMPINAVSSGDGNAWTDQGDCFCHPIHGDKEDARKNSRKWSVASEFYKFELSEVK